MLVNVALPRYRIVDNRSLDRKVTALLKNDGHATRGAFACLAFCLILLATTQAGASSFSDCLAGLRGAAQAGGVDAATFDLATHGLTPNPEVLALAEVQPEFKTPIWDYLAGLVDEERVNDGRAMMARWGRGGGRG
jgi:membrane-bound lytic murein transglycosylase B